MASNYKLSTNAYTIENFDLSHEQIHTLTDAINQNYKNGGGFGYICIPKPTDNGKPHSNFDEPTSIECRPAFVSGDLITRPGGNSDNKADNAQTFEDEEFFLFTGATTTFDAWKTGVKL